MANTTEQKKLKKKIIKKLDFLNENSELEDEEKEKLKSHKTIKIDKIYEPIIGLDKLVIKVSDNGIGIEKHQYSKLFKLFAKYNSSTQNLT